MKILLFLEAHAERCFIAACLAIMSVVLIVQVVMRYVFHAPFIWSEELSRYLLIWGALMGTSLAVRESRHISVDFFPTVFGPKSFTFFKIVAHIGNLVFCVLMCWYSIPLIIRLKSIGQLSASLEIPMWLIYSAVPAGLGCMGLRTLQALYLLAFRPRGEAAE